MLHILGLPNEMSVYLWEHEIDGSELLDALDDAEARDRERLAAHPAAAETAMEERLQRDGDGATAQEEGVVLQGSV